MSVKRKPIWFSLYPNRDSGVVGGTEEGLGLWTVIKGCDQVGVGLKVLDLDKKVSLFLKNIN